MAYVVDEKGNAKTTLNVVVPTLHDMIVAGKDVIQLTNGGVVYVAKGTKALVGELVGESVIGPDGGAQ